MRSKFGTLLNLHADNTVHLIHQSVKESLKNPEHGYFSSGQSNHVLALKSLMYLLHVEHKFGPETEDLQFESTWQNSRIECTPLLDYADSNWAIHLKEFYEVKEACTGCNCKRTTVITTGFHHR